MVWILKIFQRLTYLLVASLGIAQAASDGEVPRGMRVPSNSQIEDIAVGLGAAHPGSPRPLVPLAPQLIMAFEGWESSPYDDPSGYCTVGYGHLLAKQRCASLDLSAYKRPLSRTEGSELLEKDTTTARAAVQRLVRIELTDNQFGALSSLVFNVGKGNFANSTLLALINANALDAAAKEFGKWVVSGGKVLRGLEIRRSCESALFKNHLRGNSSNDFRREECEVLGVAPRSSNLIDIDSGLEVRPLELK